MDKLPENHPHKDFERFAEAVNEFIDALLAPFYPIVSWLSDYLRTKHLPRITYANAGEVELIYVQTAGNLTVILTNGEKISFVNLAAETMLPIKIETIVEEETTCKVTIIRPRI